MLKKLVRQNIIWFCKFWEIGLFHEAIFEICWCDFEKSDCGDTWSASFLCETGPFFGFRWLSWKKGEDEWGFGKKFAKFLQSPRAGLLKRATLEPPLWATFNSTGLWLEPPPWSPRCEPPSTPLDSDLSPRTGAPVVSHHQLHWTLTWVREQVF